LTFQRLLTIWTKNMQFSLWQKVLNPGGLFDLTGLGFSSDKKKIVRPVAPTVSIKVNGEAIEVPATPVRSTNANGIVGYDLYETTYKLPAHVSGTPTYQPLQAIRMLK
jgi:hypothetical protein